MWGRNDLGGETTWRAKRLGAKHPVGAKRLGGKRPVGKHLGGETTRGGNGLGAKRPGTIKITNDMNISDSVLLSLLISSNGYCNTGHAKM